MLSLFCKNIAASKCTWRFHYSVGSTASACIRSVMIGRLAWLNSFLACLHALSLLSIRILFCRIVKLSLQLAIRFHWLEVSRPWCAIVSLLLFLDPSCHRGLSVSWNDWSQGSSQPEGAPEEGTPQGSSQEARQAADGNFVGEGSCEREGSHGTCTWERKKGKEVMESLCFKQTRIILPFCHPLEPVSTAFASCRRDKWWAQWRYTGYIVYR